MALPPSDVIPAASDCPILPGTPEALAAAVRALAAGELVALPTETVYGLGADATNGRAVAAIYAAKGRPSFNPLIAHVADLAAAEALVRFDPLSRRLAEAAWPGPLTLVLPLRAGSPVSTLATAGLDTLAVRVPAHPLALALLEAFGRPVAAPSANRSGRISPTTAAHVAADLGTRVALILDGGPTRIGLESTIVQVRDARPHLLRPGGMTRGALEALAGCPLVAPAIAGDDGAPRAPGMLLSHYAPRAAVRLGATEPRPGEAWLGFGPGPEVGDRPTVNLSPTGDLTEAAARLFDALHQLDASGVTAIAVAPIPGHGLGEAINDRLGRAAADRT